MKRFRISRGDAGSISSYCYREKKCNILISVLNGNINSRFVFSANVSFIPASRDDAAFSIENTCRLADDTAKTSRVASSLRKVTAVTIVGNDQLITTKRWPASLRDESPS
jgi:hypothetical protein